MNFLSKLVPTSKKKLALTIISTTVLIALLSVMTFEATKAEVMVKANGETTTLRTHQDTVGDVLANLNIDVSEHDELSHNQSTELSSGMEITYLAAKPVNVVIDDETHTYYTTVDTVGELLEENEITVNDRDKLSASNDAPIESDMTVEINKAFQVTVDDGGKEKKVWTTSGTVEDLLKAEKIELSKLDELKPAKADELSADTPIVITRVEKVTDIVEESIDYSVVKKNDSSLLKGKEKVVSEGEEGLLTKEYEVTLKNGKETDRKLVKEETVKESKQRIVAVGTKNPAPPKPKTVATTKASTTSSSSPSRGSSSSSQTLYMSATAYTASCSGCSGITSTGINLNANPNAKVIAVDPNVIPLGTRVHVEGYGYAVAGDTGGAIKGNKIDLFYPSKSKALGFGRRTVKVTILK
ncbi:ubiquitin-like domain-containing protein [Thalassobacillus hwangdonensis]|uniref:Ubiquitin-like domain-containing protein n=1 Tax=Thalassobacillus hwangdonensis TaxID=546108 RepID=A0ABW3L511_9BACI